MPVEDCHRGCEEDEFDVDVESVENCCCKGEGATGDLCAEEPDPVLERMEMGEVGERG